MGWWERRDSGKMTSERDSRDTAHPVRTHGCLSDSLAASPADSRAGRGLLLSQLEKLTQEQGVGCAGQAWKSCALSVTMQPMGMFSSVCLASVGPAGWALQWDWALKLGAQCIGEWVWERAESQRLGAPPGMGREPGGRASNPRGPGASILHSEAGQPLLRHCWCSFLP